MLVLRSVGLYNGAAIGVVCILLRAQCIGGVRTQSAEASVASVSESY